MFKIYGGMEIAESACQGSCQACQGPERPCDIVTCSDHDSDSDDAALTMLLTKVSASQL